MKKNIFYTKVMFMAFVLGCNIPIQAIQKTTANILASIVAMGSTAASYKGYILAQEQIHPAFFGVADVVFASMVYYYLHTFTPEGKLKKAHTLLDELRRHKLVKNRFDIDKKFFDTVYDIYLMDDLPLISAYNHLIELLPISHAATGFINQASAEVGKNVALQEECDVALSMSKQFFNNLANALKKIREHKDYLEQLKLYKEFLSSEKQAQMQEQMLQVNYDLAHSQSQIAASQQSSTFLKWIKFLFFGK
jgi:hypothetical protein